MTTVLVNKETGLAEDLPDDQAHSALYAGTHDVPLVDANGQIGSAPFQAAQQMVAAGTHQQPNPTQLNRMLQYSENKSPIGRLKTLTEAGTEAATFGLSTPLEIATGVSTPEKIQSRREDNPVEHTIGQVGGLLTSALLPGGAEAGALKALGEGAAGGSEALGAGKLVSGAARLATEGAAFQAGDELSQHFEDPGRAMSLSAANIGMAALTTPIIGGVLGGAAELFKATKANELQNLLESAKTHIDAGAEGLTPEALDVLAAKPELKGAMSDNPFVQKQYQKLINSTTGTATEFEKGINDFGTAVSDGAVQRMGLDPEEIVGAKAFDPNQAGKDIKQAIDDHFTERLNPVKQLYEDKTEAYSDAPIYPAMRKDLSTKLEDFAAQEKFAKDPDGMGAKMMERFSKDLPLQKTADDLSVYAEKLGEKLPGYENSYLRRSLQKILRGVSDNAVITRMGEVEGPEAVNVYQNARSGYHGIMSDLEELDDRLKLGNYKGAGGALQNLKDMRTEQVVDRLSKTNDAGLTQFLDQKLPEVSQIVRQNQLQDIARKSVLKGSFNLNRFLDRVNKLNPEARGSLLSPDIYEKLQSDNKLLESLEGTINPSGTKKASSDFMRQALGSFSGFALGMMSGPKMAFLMGMLGKSVSDIPDAVRVAFLRSVGGGKSADAMAFRALADTASNVYKSMNVINKGVRTILSGSGTFAIDHMTDRQKKQLEEAAQTYQDEPEKFINTPDNHLATYEPDHANAQTMMISRAMEAINAAKPRTEGQGMLDGPMKPSKIETANYNKTLQMVENPLTILHEIGRGTLTPNSLNTFKTVFPDLHTHIAQKLTNQIIEMKSDGKSVPYKQRLSLSMFMGMPLDSTMTPNAIVMNQPKPVQQEQAPAHAKTKGSMKALDKLSGNYATSDQNREKQRAMR